MNAYGTTNTTGATNHWTNWGLPSEGRRASFIFDPVYYLQHNPDLLAAFGSNGYSAALQHFMSTGLPIEGRRGSLEFDVKYYLSHNADLAAAYGTNYLAAADHFLVQGLPVEGRRGSPDFAVQDYIGNYPDVAGAYGWTDYTDAMLHWLRRGKAFGRHAFGALPSPTECGDGHTTEYGTVPVAPAPPALPTITVAHSGAAFVSDGGVFYVNPPSGVPAQLTAVGSSPAQGQYTVAGGVYTFSAADAEQPVRINYTLVAVPPGYARIAFSHRATGVGTGTMSDPFDASVLDITLRHISEQTSTAPVPNLENGGGQPYGPYNLVVCIDSGTYSTLGIYDHVINVGHTLGNPDDPQNGYPAGFTVNKNWHIHGKGMWATTLQLSMYLANPPNWGFPQGTGLGVVIGTYDDNAGGVEISDLNIDDNYPALGGYIPINLLGINLRSDVGGHNVHNVNVTNYAGQVGAINIRFEAFPIWIGSVNNVSPTANSNNQIKYVSLGNMSPPPGACTGFTISNANAEVAFNIANGWSSAANTFGQCQGYGGWQMPGVWFHDNFAFNNDSGFLTDSLTNRGVTVEFNQIINAVKNGIVVGGGGIYDYFRIQYNTISIGGNNENGILFNGKVVGATVNNNNIVASASTSGVKGIAFGGSGNTGNVFEYNQINSSFGNGPVPSGNCVFNNWNQFTVQLSNLPNTQSSACAAPAQAYATLQTDGNFVVYGANGTALWSTGTGGTSADVIQMQDDGNLVLYQQVWQAGTYRVPSGAKVPQDSCSIGNLLSTSQILAPGSCLESASGMTFALMQSNDGNLVMYDRQLGQITWASNTIGNPGAYATLDTYGGFEVVGSTVLWTSGTAGTYANSLRLEDDGRLILYKPVWSSNTVQSPVSGTFTHPSCDVGIGTGWTGLLGAGQCFVSPNGRFELFMQADGGLVIYDNSFSPAKAIWYR